MSVWIRRSEERVAGTGTPTVPLTALFANESFNAVDVSSVSAAMRDIAIRSSVDLFASLVSELPMRVFSGLGSDRRLRPTPSYLDDPAGDGHGRADWLYQVMVSWLLRGNLYGQRLAMTTSGIPTQVDIWHPDHVSCTLVSGQPEWSYGGCPVDRASVIHARVNALPGTVLGLSVIGHHSSQIALPLTAAKYGLQWFQDGAHPQGLLSNDQLDLASLSDDQVRLIKARFTATLRGTREPALIGKGWTFTSVQVAPEESQFLATIGASEAQCCRMFGPGVAEVLGYESGGSMTYANVESRMGHLLVMSLDKWVSRAERLLSSMLPKPQYVVLDRDALLAATTLTRYQSHALALTNKWKTINEVRAGENLQPVSWGDVPAGVAAPTQEGEQ